MAHKRPCPSCKELTAVNLSVCQECGSPTRWAPAVPQVEPLKDAPIPVPIHMAKPMVEQIGEEGMAKIQKSLEDSRVPNGYQKCPDCSKLFSVLTRECPYCAEATEVTTLERLSDSRKQDEAATALAERGSRVEANRPIVDLLITINAKVLELKGISGLDLLCAVVNPIDEKRVLNLVQQAADGLVFMEDLIRVATRHRK